MSKRDKLIKEIETMSEQGLNEVERFVEGLKNNLHPDRSPEELQRAFDNLQNILSNVPPFEIDLKKAKDEYFEGKYGRID
ncbi:MAG: hypothetical protein LBM41_01095 [Ruminococcus sp.]|jgi:hypothetical protein|nr:hypothetical protein [Ruminococcus sp.]